MGPGGSDAKIATTDAYLRDREFNGAVLVADRDTVLLVHGYGVAEATSGRPIAADTIFPIGSITKVFTALAVLQLHERGLLDLDDPVSDYLPEFPDGDRITLHHLLSHTAGVPRDLSEYATVPDEADVEAALAAYPGAPLAFEPGSDFLYSNLGYELLTRVIERVAGLSYEAYMQTVIFDPLGMENSGVAVEPLVDPRAASGYVGDAESGESVPPLHARWWKGAGGIYSTVEDLYRWERGLANGTLLGADALREMHTAQSATSAVDGQGYGYGWQVIEPQRAVWHGGDMPGYHAWLVRDIERDVTVIALSNEDSWAGRGIDLIELHQRGLEIESSRLYPAVPLILGGVAVLGCLGLSLGALYLRRRGGLRFGRPGVVRLALQFVLPGTIAVVAVLVALDPVRSVGSWEALTIVAPALAWLSVALLLLATFLIVIAASAFVRPLD